MTPEVQALKDKMDKVPNAEVSYQDMFAIDKNLRKHYVGDRDSFMLKMIANVDKHLNSTFDYLD